MTFKISRTMDLRLSDEGTIYIDCNINRDYPMSVVIQPENIQSFIDAVKRLEKLMILK